MTHLMSVLSELAGRATPSPRETVLRLVGVAKYHYAVPICGSLSQRRQEARTSEAVLES